MSDLYIQNKLFKSFSKDELFTHISFDRLKTKDYLLEVESRIIRKHLFGYYRLDTPLDNIAVNNLNFLQSDESAEYSVIPFLTLPIFDKTAQITSIASIWAQYFNYAEFNFVNMPSGYYEPEYVFIGEAPGWSEDQSNYNVTVYSYGQTSLTFRLLAYHVFGPRIWFTNLSKSAIPNNKKLFSSRDFQTLEVELQLLKPKAIICLGNTVYEILKPAYPVYKIFHPAYIARKGNDINLYKQNMLDIWEKIYHETSSIL